MKPKTPNTATRAPIALNIERRSYPPQPAEFTDLPFIADMKIGLRKKRRSFWNVPPTDNYVHANAVGMQYACDFVQYLKENTFWVGAATLGHIVHDMAQYNGDPDMNGYAVGFFAYMEKLLYVAATSTDHYAIAESDIKRTAAFLAALNEEGQS